MKENKKSILKHFNFNNDWIQKSNQKLTIDLLRKQIKTKK